MSTQAAGDSNKLKDGLELTEHNISSLEGQPQGNDVVAIHTDLKETSEDTQETEKRSPPAGTQPTNETGEPESPQATVNGMISANPPVPNERKAPQSSQANSESSSETADVTIPLINGRPKKVHPPTPWSKWQKYMILSVLTAILVTHIILVIVLILIKVQDNPPPVKPSPLQFQHAFFHLKTRGYTELEKDTYLRWKRDESQDEVELSPKSSTILLCHVPPENKSLHTVGGSFLFTGQHDSQRPQRKLFSFIFHVSLKSFNTATYCNANQISKRVLNILQP
ncbi:Hypothetical predicted protein [Octopus vulgaris]|uniref:Uncharacterized protein n=1 Tax=Octopus vulgaris TaxID=6645 RepID=A0AA36BTC0_OCTVU|nr:Hypothetical predicted protein [Octopus vulgaris]